MRNAPVAMEHAMRQRSEFSGSWVWLVRLAVTLIALPFLVGAVSLGWQLAHLPNTAGHLATAQLLGAALFTFGLFLGLVGAAFTLTSTPGHRRILGTAVTLFGCAHVLFGFYVRRAIESSVISTNPVLLPLVIPAALWACSVWLAVRAPGLAASESEETPKKEATEEQPQPLSRP